MPAYASCCDQTTGRGRWTYECVQKGADLALNTYSQGDVCQRYAWNQGTVAGTNQAYPRDFSMVALGGSVYNFRDMAGPVAANGDVMPATGFNLGSANYARDNKTVAAIATGKVGFTSGTVWGNVKYGTTYTGQWTTYRISGTTYSSFSQSPINFGALTTNLTTMSNGLAKYPSNGSCYRVDQSTNIRFDGQNPELNVFSLSTDLINDATSFYFNVPKGSAIIVNVTGQNTKVGTNAYFTNAGFAGTYGVPPNSKILWNFPDTKVLQVSSMTFPGSILAPIAEATLLNGAINGTVVVHHSLNAAIEFHWYPFQGFACSHGCLCWDSSWSCSLDTYLDDTGYVKFPAPEAGFLSIEGESYTAENVTRYSPTHRIWYSFQPAASSPEVKPLAVLFNGGPGSATSAILFGFNTGPMTVDPDLTSSGPIVNSTSNWTNHANVLYIDAPATGFSYPMPPAWGGQADIGIDIDHDAGIFLRFIVRFLARHPAIQKNRVVLVGESYGGTRATLMLNYLLNYKQVGTDTGSGPYRDYSLHTDLNKYFTAVFNTTTPDTRQLLSKFGHQVLISPAVVGSYQQDQKSNVSPSNCIVRTSNPSIPCYASDSSNPQICDYYDCDKALNWGWDQMDKVGISLTNLATLNKMVGVDAKTIEWMYARSRTDAYGRDYGRRVSNPSDMNNQFGTLVAGDNYFMVLTSRVSDGYGCMRDYVTTGSCTGQVSRQWGDLPANGAFSCGHYVGTNFLTNVQAPIASLVAATTCDTVIRTPTIALALNNGDFLSLVKTDGVKYSASYQTKLLNGTGAMTINYQSSTSATVVAMPTYASGHSVTMRKQSAADLLADFARFYTNSPH